MRSMPFGDRGRWSRSGMVKSLSTGLLRPAQDRLASMKLSVESDISPNST
jgi:hypothetical protein